MKKGEVYMLENDKKVSNKLLGFYLIIESILFISIKLAEWKAPYAVTGKLMYSAIVLNFLIVLYRVMLQKKHDGVVELSIENMGIPLALLVTVIADTFLVLINDIYIAGFFFFGVVETIYAFYLKMSWKNGIFRVVMYGIFLLVLYLTGALNAGNIVAAWSMTQLTINVVISWIAYSRDKNSSSLLFAIGILLFFGCDVCVGIRNGLEGTADALLYKVVASLVWTCYVPAQVAIVMSYFKKRS